MKNNIFKLLLASGLMIIIISGCTKKLDLTPTNDITADEVYSTPQGYKESLAKIYLALAMPGNVGNNSSGGWGGSPDIPDRTTAPAARALELRQDARRFRRARTPRRARQ